MELSVLQKQKSILFSLICILGSTIFMYFATDEELFFEVFYGTNVILLIYFCKHKMYKCTSEGSTYNATMPSPEEVCTEEHHPSPTTHAYTYAQHNQE